MNLETIDSSETSNLSEGVKSTFEKHHNEIRRRSTLVQDGGLNSSRFERVEANALDDPFVNPEQKFVVFSLSTKEFAPVPVDSCNTGLCIYGAFETMEDAHAHARLVQAQHPTFSVLVDGTHKWIVAANTMEHLTNSEFVQSHAQSLLDKVEAQREKNRQEFEENVRNRTAGAVTTPSEEDPASTPETVAAAQKVNKQCSAPDQKFVAVSFVQDKADKEYPEFLFFVYACYETEDAMNRYVCNTCGDRVTHFDIDVIKTCTWAFPQRMTDGKNVPKEVYRSSELNKVMNTHKKTPQEVERFYNEHPDALEGSTSNAPPAAVVEVSDEVRSDWEDGQVV